MTGGFRAPKILPSLPTLNNKGAQGMNTITGVDTSHYEPVIDWQKVAGAGHRFGITKATDGLAGIDSCFVKHNQGAAAAGLVTGAYHFLRFNVSPTAQAEHFWAVVKGMKGPSVPLILDAEWSKSEAVNSIRGHEEHVLACLGRIESLSGETPLLYTAFGFFGDAQQPERFSRYPLWIAHYHTKAPHLPAPFNSYYLWQRAEDEDVPGIGKCDVSQGDEAVFSALVSK